MQYITIFHANLNYAYLLPERYEFVIRNSYELILDTMGEQFPDVKFVFEASGFTLDQIAALTPDVLDKLRAAIAEGRCEFMGSSYAHPMLPNFPREDGTWSIRFSNETYARHLGLQPRSFWNPECGWRSYVPLQVLDTGYCNLLGDFEAYSRSCDAAGKPLRPAIYAAEHSEEKAFYSFGFKYALPGEERAIHSPFAHIAGAPEGRLRMFLRTDRVAQFGVRFFMGMEGYTLQRYLNLIHHYSQQPAGEPEGALIIFADDAEYIGTNGWFRLKYQNKPDNVFEQTPDSREKLIQLISECKKMGDCITFDEACNRLPPLEEEITFDDDSAWHGGRASTWAETPMARLLRPWQDLVRDRIHALTDSADPATLKLAWFYLTNSYNSDGQWPPTLPDAPHIVHPFNYAYCFDNLMRADLLTGGVDRDQLQVDPVETLREVLGMQQELVLAKADTLGDCEAGRTARSLIETSRNVDCVRGQKLLYPAEYKARADALVEARRLVGGVDIEKVATTAEEFIGPMGDP